MKIAYLLLEDGAFRNFLGLREIHSRDRLLVLFMQSSTSEFRLYFSTRFALLQSCYLDDVPWDVTKSQDLFCLFIGSCMGRVPGLEPTNQMLHFIDNKPTCFARKHLEIGLLTLTLKVPQCLEDRFTNPNLQIKNQLPKMVIISIPIFSLPLCHLISSIIFLVSLFSAPHFSLSLSNRPYFDPNLVLIGDAKFTNNSFSIRLTDPKNSFPSSGCVIQKKPINIFGSNSRPIRPISFSTAFTFSISPHNGDGLAFILVSRKFMLKFQKKVFGLPKESPFFAVEYDTFLDENLGDVNSNHVGIDVGSLVSKKTSNVSSINVVLNSGVKLQSWIDYDSSSKRLEVRLSKFGLARPYNPLLVYRIDLGEMWRNGEVFVGLSSSSGNSMQTSDLYSWNFKTRSVPKWLHSQPVDPQVFSNIRNEEKRNNRRWVCVLGLLSGFITIIGCGALIAVVVMFVWAMIENSRQTIVTIPTTCTVQPGDFKYQKINVVINDNSVDVKH